MKRLKVEIAASQAEKDYNSGKSTQVPTGLLIGVRGRISRKIGYGGDKIYYEYIPSEQNAQLNSETIQAIEDIENKRNLNSYKTVDESFKKLGM